MTRKSPEGCTHQRHSCVPALCVYCTHTATHLRTPAMNGHERNDSIPTHRSNPGVCLGMYIHTSLPVNVLPCAYLHVPFPLTSRLSTLAGLR